MSDGLCKPPSHVELARRCQTLQEVMQRRGIDGVLLCNEVEVRYFCGFATPFWQSPTRMWFLLILPQGAPVAIIPSIGRHLMESCYVADVHCWHAPSAGNEGIELLSAQLRTHCGAHPRLGLMLGPETMLRMPISDFRRLEEQDIEFVDVTTDIQAMRQIKSPYEIDCIARVAEAVGAVFQRLPELIRRGMSQADLFTTFRINALAAGAEEIPYLVGGQGPGGYRDIISPPSDAPLCEGDIVMLDTGCTRGGYYCDFDRNVALGTAPDEAHRVYQLLHRAVDAGCESAKVGRRACDVFRAMEDVIRNGGYPTGDVGRYGHGVGLQLTETPSVAPWDETVLRESMVLAIEPSLNYGDGLMMVHEENIVITESGARLLTPRAASVLPELAV